MNRNDPQAVQSNRPLSRRLHRHLLNLTGLFSDQPHSRPNTHRKGAKIAKQSEVME